MIGKVGGILAAAILAIGLFLGWSDAGYPPFGERSSSASQSVSVQPDDLPAYTIAISEVSGAALLPQMEIDTRPLSKNAENQVVLHTDSSLPAFFLSGSTLQLPADIAHGPVVIVAHTASKGVDVGFGPFTFMSSLPQGSNDGSEVVTIDGSALNEPVVCRSTSVIKGPSAMPDSVYLDAPAGTLILITCALNPDGTIDSTQGVRLTASCSF